jgi:mannose-6-phosphate isomerase-like protein (cupin superfamily)
MKRRHFLQIPLFAPFLTAYAQNLQGQVSQKGFVIKSRKDRYQEELHIMGGQFDCKISAKDTNGALCMYDTLRQAKGGPALHVHHSQDELFYVIKGEFTVKVGEGVFNLKAGDFAFAPRKVPHTFAKTDGGEGQMLIMFQPAGSMEGFSKQMSKLGGGVPGDYDKALKDLWATHGMEIVGPPLKV